MEPARIVHRQIWREGNPSLGTRSIPEETAVALTYNGGTWRGLCGIESIAEAVCPAAVVLHGRQFSDLEDFAIGFSLSEGVINSSADVGAEKLCDWGVRDGVGFGAHRAGCSHGGRRGYHACCHRARGRL
jgi:formate dehydrogenase assembly factor FdhD